MRILHISTRLILGGSQENTVLSCEGQAERGHDVHLAFGPIYGPEGSLLERVEKFRTSDGRVGGRGRGRITTHVVPHMVRDVHPWNDLCAYRELRELVERLKPDVVHTHSSKAGILGRIAAWRLGEAGDSLSRRRELSERLSHDVANGVECPDGLRHRLNEHAIIHTIHGPPFMPIEGSPLSRAKIALSNTVYEIAERIAAEHCHTIVSVADAMTNQFLARGIGLPNQYVTVRSGMDVEPFLHAAPGEDRATVRAGLGLGNNDFVIGTVARLAQHKGHDDILDALAQDLRQHPNWKLLWVGDGWWRERLLRKAREMGVGVRELDRRESSRSHADGIAAGDSSAQLILTGLVPPTRIPALMRSMDVLAHPSYREGLPRTVPQALLAGAFPIAYDCDGTREVCVDMQTGRLVATGDIASLREAINWAYQHPVERAAMTAAGQQRCVREFSTQAMVDGLEKVYTGSMGPKSH